ncbi:MAG TPA: hypothetical protein PKJ63_05710, partial [Cyclobacteriaceae bacterium]|nr:hypothetical protein [Cyclobacteriaceae bacterium]
MKSITILFSTFFCFSVAAQELVKDINTQPGGLNFPCYPCGNLVYTLIENDLGRELWKTDGTMEGTSIVRDLYPGQESGASGGLQCINDRIFMTGRDSGFESKLFSSDGNEIVKEADVVTRFFAGFQDKIAIVTANQLWIK